jgi:hypothetical protein
MRLRCPGWPPSWLDTDQRDDTGGDGLVCWVTFSTVRARRVRCGDDSSHGDVDETVEAGHADDSSDHGRRVVDHEPTPRAEREGNTKEHVHARCPTEREVREVDTDDPAVDGQSVELV